MTLVSPQMLASIRATALAALSDTCTILRPRAGSDDGYRKGGWQTVAAGVPCRLMDETQRDAGGVVVDREAGRTFWRIAVPPGTDLRDGDTVEHNGERYNVLQLFKANTDTVFVEAALGHIEAPA